MTLLNADWARAWHNMLTAAAPTARLFKSESMTADVTILEHMHGEHGLQHLPGELERAWQLCHLHSLKRRLISMSTMRPGKKVGPNQLSQKFGVTTT